MRCVMRAYLIIIITIIRIAQIIQTVVQHVVTEKKYVSFIIIFIIINKTEHDGNINKIKSFF